MTIEEIIADIQNALLIQKNEYERRISENVQQITERVEYQVVNKLANEIIETSYSGKETLKNAIYEALQERIKSVIDQTWEKLQQGNYRTQTLDQYLEKRIAELIDRKIGEQIDKVILMVVRTDEQTEEEE